MTLFRWMLVTVALALSGCASTSFEKTTTLQSGTEISGASVVVYSFLDVRKGVFGEQMLAMMNVQLVEQFKQRGVNARVVVYQQPAADANPNALFLGVNRDVVQVPIKEYLNSSRCAPRKRSAATVIG